MIDIKDSQIAQILPRYLAEQPEVKALSFALKNAVQRLLEYADGTAIWYALDSISEELCDLLAIELDTQYYDTSLDIEAKRNLVKNTFIWYSRAGTPSAVAELVEAVFGEGKVIENWDFDDRVPEDAYTFDIETNAPMREDTLRALATMINKTKNARSHMRGVRFRNTLEVDLNFGAGFISKPRTTISMDVPVSSDVQVPIVDGAGLVSVPTTVIS